MEYINRKNAKDFIKKYCNKKDFNKALEIASRFKVRDVTITLNRAIKEYKLSKKQIENLNYVEADNPYYKKAGAMKLCLISEVQNLIKK
jgi:hypothetical protein